MAYDEKLGDFLRREREARGISIEAVAEKTKISLTNLRALEQGSWSVFRSEFFIKGFLRQYARVIGLDEGAVMERYHAERPSVLAALPHSEEGEARMIMQEPASRLFRVPLFSLGAATLLAIVFGVWYWFFRTP